MNSWTSTALGESKLNKRTLIAIVSILVLSILLGKAMFYLGAQAWLLLLVPPLLFAFVFALSSPFNAFLVFILTLPLEATLVIEAGFTIRPSYLLLLFLIAFMIISQGRWFTKSSLDIPIIAYLAVCGLSIVQTILVPPPQVELSEVMKYRGSDLRSIIQLLLLIFYSLTYFFTVYFCSGSKRRLDIALKTYICMALIISAYGIYQAFAAEFNLPLKSVTNALSTGGSGYESVWGKVPFQYYRSTATFQEPLNFGHYLLSILPFLMAFLVTRRGYIDLNNHKWLGKFTLTLMILIMTLAIFMSRSRGAWISLVAATFVLFTAVRVKGKVRLFGYLSLSILFLGAFYILTGMLVGGYGSFADFSRFSPQALDSDPRLEYYTLILKLYSQHPILGVGIGNFPLHGAAMLNTRNVFSSHGVWWQTLIETGFIGFAVLCWLVFTYYKVLIRTLAKVKHTSWYPYILGYLACFTALMVQSLSFGDRLNQYTWFFMGISMATVRLIEQDNSTFTHVRNSRISRRNSNS